MLRLKLCLGWRLTALALLLIGLPRTGAQQLTPYPYGGNPPEGIVFPNQATWPGLAAGSPEVLIGILVRSHQAAVAGQRQLDPMAGQAATTREHLATVTERNLNTAKMAHGLLVQLAAQQGTSQMTLFYPPGSTAVPDGSAVHKSLHQYAADLEKRSQGRRILVTAIGSNAPYGSEGGNRGLALERARVPAAILQTAFGRTDHAINLLDGVDSIYYPQGLDGGGGDRRYQYTRLIAVFATGTPTTAATAIGGDPRVTAEITPVGYADLAYRQSAQSPYGQAPLWENRLGMKFVHIPPGTFTMGSPENEPERDPDERQHLVTLTRGFYMQATEVTQGQWKAVMGNNPANFADSGWDCPIENVSWYQVRDFIDKLNAELPADQPRYRLPTEAEWEYAARAGSPNRFYAASADLEEDEYIRSLDAIAWHHGNSGLTVHPVASKQPNAWGLYDMHGNVWEWCQDWDGAYPPTAVVDPVGAVASQAKIRRGGGWNHLPLFCRAGDRSRHRAEEAAPNLGFRLVRDLALAPIAMPAAPVVAPQAAVVPPPAAAPCDMQSEQNGLLTVRRGLPDVGPRSVYVERQAPTAIVVGQPIRYTLRVYNGSPCEILQVVLTEQPSPLFAVSSTEPAAQQLANGALRWQIDHFPAQSVREFVVNGVATGGGELSQCATVQYTQQLCSSMHSVKPELNVTMQVAPAALACEAIPVVLTVTNPGTGPATNITVNLSLPRGLTAPSDQRELAYTVGQLDGGQTREFRFNATASEVGAYRLLAVATGDGLRSEIAGTVTVTAPVLRLAASAPTTQFTSRPVPVTITVSNAGNAPARNLRVQTTIPAGMTALAASHEGGQTGDAVVWQLPGLGPNQSAQLSVTLQANQPGTFTTVTAAGATCAAAVQASTSVNVRGIAAILLEVADEVDPIQIGHQGTYLIVATNQGSIASTNVRISCTLEDNVKFVNATGSTAARQNGNRVEFAPLPRLEANGKATWRVTVEAVKAGDVRFRVDLNSDQLQRPVEETEATTVY